MGAKKWKDSYTDTLKGKHIILIPDNDDGGLDHMTRVGSALNGHVASLKLLTLPDLPSKGDVTDFINQFKDKEEAAERLSLMIEGAEPYQPEKQLSNDKNNFSSIVVAAKISSIIDQAQGQIKKNQQAGSIGKKTGLRIIDNTIHGLVKSYLYAVGGYTSAGKTALMVQIIVNLLLHNDAVKVAIFSLEMTQIQILLRIISNWTAIPSLEIYRGNLGQEQSKLASSALQRFRDSNIYIFDNIKKLDQMETLCQELAPLDAIFVDFAQLIHERGGSIYERMSTVSLKLQDMAKRLDTAAVILSQIDNESARNPSDVIGYKGGGELAAASDLAIWLTRNKKDETLMDCIVRKNRHGPKGRSVLKYINHWTSLEEQ
jgi:replicative DNA helicase